MSSSRSPERPRAFTLIELAIALLVLAVLASGLALPLAAQLEQRREAQTRRQLEEAKDAILGFAAANGRLPCPASASSNGEESFAPGGDSANGNCSNFYDGWLPGASLGLAPLDAEGFVRDAWTSRANRIRYAVFGAGAAINAVPNALTRADGMQAATLPALAAASHYIFICASGAPASGSGCGPASNQLTRRAAFVLVSLGANAQAPARAGGDEARNLAGDPVFVHHEASAAPGAEFDDIVTWVPVHLVVSRLLAAGRLP